MNEKYSTAQKLALAGIVVAAIMCAVGAGAPYWLVTDPSGGDDFLTSAATKLVGKVVKAYMGLFMACVEVKITDEMSCSTLEPSSGWFHTAWMLASVCVLLSIICALSSLCLACCSCCKRLIALGIVTFLAALSGAASAAIFAKNTDVWTSDIAGFKVVSYGWAFFLFCGGVGLMGLVSIMACFAAPENPMRGIIFGQANPSAAVVVASSHTTAMPYYHLQDAPNTGHVAVADPRMAPAPINGY